MELIVLLRQFGVAHSALSLVAVAATLLVLYFVARSIYRITYHPLCAFPGPKLRAISHLPRSFASLKGREVFVVRDLHARHGDVVRIAPDTLSFMTPGAWTDIYGHAATKRFRKYGYFEIRADAQTLLTANEINYPRQHAALAHGFSEQAIHNQEIALTKHVNELTEKLEEKAKYSQYVDISMWMNFLMFDIIGEFTLSTQFGCVANSKNHPWVILMIKWMHAASSAFSASEFGLLAPLITPLVVDRKDLMGIKTHLELSSAKVRERIKTVENPSKPDLWTYVLRNKGDQSISLAEMEVNAAFLFSAATAPMADIVCAAVYLLGKNQEVLNRLRNELESLLKSDRDITISATSKIPYLNAVIKESIRCYTPFPGGSRRQAPPGGAYVSGYVVPEGTVVCVSQLPSFTLASNFALPDRYLPSRWLPANHPDRPQVTLSDKHGSFNPFGVGPKACLGKGLAYVELQLILAKFVWHFDFELLDDGFAFERQRAYIFRERPPLMVKLSARNH